MERSTPDATLDSIGAALFPIQAFDDESCTAAIRAFDGIEYPRIAILYKTFGSDETCIKRWVEEINRPHEILIHGQNETCRRAGRCESVEVAPSLSVEEFNLSAANSGSYAHREVMQRVGSLEQFIKRVKTDRTEILVSTGLENDFDRSTASFMAWAYSRLGYPVVHNPVSGAERVEGTILELHNFSVPDGPPCSWSNDGFDIDFGDGVPGPSWGVDELLDYLAGSVGCRRYVWLNIQQYNPARFLPPSKRQIKFNLGQAESLNAIMRHYQ